MGVEWIVVCRDCKKRVDIYKNRLVPELWNGAPISSLGRDPHPYELVDTFRFMRRHWGHKVDLDGSEDDDYGYDFATYIEEFPTQSEKEKNDGA